MDLSQKLKKPANSRGVPKAFQGLSLPPRPGRSQPEPVSAPTPEPSASGYGLAYPPAGASQSFNMGTPGTAQQPKQGFGSEPPMPTWSDLLEARARQAAARVAALPTAIPNAEVDPDVLAAAQDRQAFRASAGLPKYIRDARAAGAADAQAILARRRDDPRSALSPRAGDAAGFRALTAQRKAADQAYAQQVSEGYARQRADTNNNGIPDRDEVIAEKFGKHGINSFNELSRANAKYANYLKDWRANGQPGRAMKTDEFFAYLKKEGDQQEPWRPGESGESIARSGELIAQPSRQWRGELRPTQKQPSFRHIMARNQAIASSAAAFARARGATPAQANAIALNTLAQQGRLQAAGDMMNAQQANQMQQFAFEQIGQLANESAKSSSAMEIAKYNSQQAQALAQAQSKAKAAQQTALWEREDSLRKDERDFQREQETRGLIADQVKRDPALLAQQTFDEAIASGMRFDDAKTQAERAYRSAKPVYEATAQAMGIDRPAGELPSFADLSPVSLPEGGLMDIASSSQVQEVAKQLVAVGDRSGRKVTEADIERELNRNGLTMLHPDYQKKNMQQTGVFEGIMSGLLGPGFDAMMSIDRAKKLQMPKGVSR